MAYTGQPVPTTTHQHGYFKVSDGKSVRVTVPANSGDVKVGELVEFGGFLGFAVRGEHPIQAIKPGNALDNSDKDQVLILSIEQAEYETDQIDEEGDFAAGTLVYWDGANKVLTESATDEVGNPLRPAGRITVGKDENGVVWFILGPQVFGTSGGAEDGGGGVEG